MKKAIKLGIISSVFILYLGGGAYWFNTANKQNTVELFGISASIDSLYDIPDSISFNYRPIEIDKVPGIRLESKKKEPSPYYHSNEKIVLTAKDRECLLKNIFYESGSEPLSGKIAVAQVTFNRLADGRWGKTLCQVVYAKSQFSWTIDHKKRNARLDDSTLEESIRALNQYLYGKRITGLERGTHFHATWIHKKPSWTTVKPELITIGQHTFYASLR
jgi:spore germination cell wall hydrolase CwlJ-like protein